MEKEFFKEKVEFKSFEEFKIHLDHFQKQTKNIYTIRSSKTLNPNKDPKKIVYKKIRYKCKFGGFPKTRGKKIRKTR